MKLTKEQLDLVSDITERNVFTQCIDGIWHYGQIHIDPNWFTAESCAYLALRMLEHAIVQTIARDRKKDIYLSLIPVEIYHRYLLEVSND